MMSIARNDVALGKVNEMTMLKSAPRIFDRRCNGFQERTNFFFTTLILSRTDALLLMFVETLTLTLTPKQALN